MKNSRRELLMVQSSVRSKLLLVVLVIVCIGYLSQTFGQQRVTSRTADKAVIDAVLNFTNAQVSKDSRILETLYAPDAIRIGPSNVEPIEGRTSILKHLSAATQTTKPIYIYLRQPEALMPDSSSALVAANYESGDEINGKLVENNGKVLYVLTYNNSKWVVGAEAIVPNLGTGSYGPLGTALQPLKRYGVLSPRSLNQLFSDLNSEAKSHFSNPKDQRLLSAVDDVNSAWSSGNVDKLEALVDPHGAFSIGDFGPFYLTGFDNLHQHFADFYRTSKVNSIKVGLPSIREFGVLGVAAFQFDTVITVEGKELHAPGLGMYVFRNIANHSLMAGCSESMFVERELGDPYQ
jgi:ketosteroid isomerase-like protein